MANNSEKKNMLTERKVIEVIVRPNSGRNEMIYDDEKKLYVVHVKAAAEDGKANAEVLKIIKKESGLSGKIISGATSRKKLIRLI